MPLLVFLYVNLSQIHSNLRFTLLDAFPFWFSILASFFYYKFRGQFHGCSQFSSGFFANFF